VKTEQNAFSSHFATALENLLRLFPQLNSSIVSYRISLEFTARLFASFNCVRDQRRSFDVTWGRAPVKDATTNAWSA